MHAANCKNGDVRDKLLFRAAGSPIASEMSALSTPTAPTTDSNSGFSPDQQEKALRDIQDRLLAVKRVLSVVQQDSANNSCVVPESSIDEIRRLKFNLCTALNPSDMSAHGRLLGRLSFDLSCSPSATDDVPLKKYMDNRSDKLSHLSTYKSLPPIEKKVRFHDKSKQSQEPIYPSTRCTSGVNPETRFPYPPPVRPLPLAERGSSPVTVRDYLLLSCRLADPVFSMDHNGHVQHGTDRVVKQLSPKSIVDITEATKAQFVFKPSAHPRLQYPSTLSPTVKTKSNKGPQPSLNINHFDHVVGNSYIPSLTPQAHSLNADDSISVMATTKSVFPQHQQHHHEERNSDMIAAKETDSHTDTLRCSNHWNSFPQPKKITTKHSRRLAKSASFSVSVVPLQPAAAPSPPISARRNTTNRQSHSPSTTPAPNTVNKMMVPSKIDSSNSMRKVKSCDLQWKREEKRQYKQQNSL